MRARLWVMLIIAFSLGGVSIEVLNFSRNVLLTATFCAAISFWALYALIQSYLKKG